jgi:transcriptional regulator GlxA family with amidase domain
MRAAVLASTRVSDLVKQAMTYFETDRQAAWRCLSDASMLLGANVAALSRSHFSRAFKHSLGLSPMEYVVVRRVERAKAMITSTRESLADVAVACGFADQSHLNRRFRDHIGMSPGQWRRSTRVQP